jgi:transcriptional regulator with XRE-family HTH domain
MLGKRIKELRQRNEISLEDLALNSGLTVESLNRIEGGEIERLEVRELLKIVDSLHLKSAYDFTCLLQLNKAPRRFQAYAVGLPKTGTVSLVGIFGNYRSSHEFDQWNTHQTIIKYYKEEISRDQFREYIKKRDLAGGLPEMDSSHFNRHYMDILAEEFPSAKFICLIRDCYSWVSSSINYFTHPEREALQSQELRNGMPFDLPRGSNSQKEELVKNFHKYIDKPIAHWASSYRDMLAKLPPGRSIIIKTNELSDKIPDLARFTGVPEDSLIRERSHLNKAEYKVNILHGLDYEFLEARFNEHCKDLMQEFFPGYSLKDYLGADLVAS